MFESASEGKRRKVQSNPPSSKDDAATSWTPLSMQPIAPNGWTPLATDGNRQLSSEREKEVESLERF